MTIPRFLLSLIICLSAYSGFACSCLFSSFCELVRDYDQVALKVKPIRHALYESIETENIFALGGQQAVYLEVLQIYQSHIELTDTIKLYGSNNDAACAVAVHQVFPLGETFIATFQGWNPNYIINPDSLNENYTEAHPDICTIRLGQINGTQVKGRFNDFEIENIPISQLLNDCGLNQADLCSFSHFKAFPNPSYQQNVILRNPRSVAIQQINVYNNSGQLVAQQSVSSTIEPENIPLPSLPRGIYFLEIISTEARCPQKIIVL